MKKMLINVDNEEKNRILKLHESFKNTILKTPDSINNNIQEQSFLKSLLGLSDNVLSSALVNNIVTAGGSKIKTISQLKKAIKNTNKLPDGSINPLGLTTKAVGKIGLSSLKDGKIIASDKLDLIDALINSKSFKTKYSNMPVKDVKVELKNAGFPDDVINTISQKFKPGQSVPKPNIGGKTNTGGNVDDVFLTNTKKLRSDFETAFPEASSSDIAKLVNNVKLGLPTSEKAVESLYKSAVSNYNPTYLRTLQKNANKISYWDRYLALPKKLKYGLLALGAVGSCVSITPVFGTDCSTLLADITNRITSGVYNYGKQLKRPGSTPGTTPETITTEAQLRAKYPCVNGEAGVRFSPITNNKCTVTFSNGESYELTINGDKVTYTQDGSEIC